MLFENYLKWRWKEKKINWIFELNDALLHQFAQSDVHLQTGMVLVQNA